MVVPNMKDLIIKEEDTRLIYGYASVEILDRQKDMVPVETLQKAMLKYMERGAPLMYGHENKIIGKVINWNVTTSPDYDVPAVEITAMINKGYKVDDEVWELIKENKLTGFSIGGTAVKIGNAKMSDGSMARVLEEIELSEISVVVEPANQGAIISAMSIAKENISTPLSDEEVENIAKGIVKDILLENSMSTNIEKKKKKYPWKTCIADQKRSGHSAESANKICGSIKAKYGKAVGMVDYDEDFMMHQFILKDNAPNKPSTNYMETCVKHIQERGLDVDSKPFCAFLWLYYFKTPKEAEEWAESDEEPTPDMLSAHAIHRYFKYVMFNDEAKKAIEKYKLPDIEWYNKCVNGYEGAVDPNTACMFVWLTGDKKLIQKDYNESFPIVDKQIDEIKLYFVDLKKRLEQLVSIEKEIASCKSWAECMKTVGEHDNTFGKQRSQNICGVYRKSSGDSEVNCINCGSANITTELSKSIDGIVNDKYQLGVYKKISCADCKTAYEVFKWSDGHIEERLKK
ncbi:MAG: XkdF-like putative serine protease domain-containing protein [Candidatus Parvarchaeum sp.]